jgi:hypothetical protein
MFRAKAKGKRPNILWQANICGLRSQLQISCRGIWKLTPKSPKGRVDPGHRKRNKLKRNLDLFLSSSTSKNCLLRFILFELKRKAKQVLEEGKRRSPRKDSHIW